MVLAPPLQAGSDCLSWKPPQTSHFSTLFLRPPSPPSHRNSNSAESLSTVRNVCLGCVRTSLTFVFPIQTSVHVLGPGVTRDCHFRSFQPPAPKAEGTPKILARKPHPSSPAAHFAQTSVLLHPSLPTSEPFYPDKAPRNIKLSTASLSRHVTPFGPAASQSLRASATTHVVGPRPAVTIPVLDAQLPRPAPSFPSRLSAASIPQTHLH